MEVGKVLKAVVAICLVYLMIGEQCSTADDCYDLCFGNCVGMEFNAPDYCDAKCKEFCTELHCLTKKKLK